MTKPGVFVPTAQRRKPAQRGEPSAQNAQAGLTELRLREVSLPAKPGHLLLCLVGQQLPPRFVHNAPKRSPATRGRRPQHQQLLPPVSLELNSRNQSESHHQQPEPAPENMADLFLGELWLPLGQEH